MKKIISILLCLCMVLPLLTGCRAESPESYVPTGDALVMEGDEEAQKVQLDENQSLSLAYYPTGGMNPLTSENYTNRVIFPLVYQSLFSVSRDNKVVPILCESFTVSADHRTYEFSIDAQATFSDGTPVTAQDVADSLNVARQFNFYAGRFQQIGWIYPTEAGTVIVALNQPNGDLTRLLDIPIVKSAEAWNECPTGSGPYIFGGTEESRFLSRRSNWWCESNDFLLSAQKIPLKEAYSPTEVRDYFEFDDVGVVCTDPGSDRYVEYRCDYELWDCETGMFLYVGFNVNSALFKQVGMRQAVIKGIDRAKLVDTYYRGFATVAELPASVNSPYYTPSLAQNYSYNQEDFKTLVSGHGAAGWTIRLLVNSGDSLRVKVAQEIGRMLNASGLIVSVVAVDGGTFNNMLAAGDFDLYLGQTKLSPNMDLSSFFSLGGPLCYGGIADITAYNLCLQALENEGNYYALHQTVMDNALICPLLFRSYAVYAARGLVTQLQPARDNLFFYTIA